MSNYLTVDDFLAYDAQITRRLGHIGEGVNTVKEQISNLATAFTSYVAETDTYRIETGNQLNGINTKLDYFNTRLGNFNSQLADFRSDLNSFKQKVNSRFDTLEQTVNRGFNLIFAHLGIQP